MGTRFTVQVSRAQRVGEARVSGINFVFDIWGIGVGYWFCVSFFFFFRGGFLAELLWSRRFGGFLYLLSFTSFMDANSDIILLRFKITRIHPFNTT